MIFKLRIVEITIHHSLFQYIQDQQKKLFSMFELRETVDVDCSSIDLLNLHQSLYHTQYKSLDSFLTFKSKLLWLKFYENVLSGE